ncbi:MAG: ABC transporter ATP-binding protein [Anaerolineales bacterium]|nr:ABC transporter ATP-binding protein [Anaerolineales bacterium]
MIKIENLTKSYGTDKGVFDLSFQVLAGEVFGYLGPNGAGKTTTIRHLMGFLNPDTGRCFVNDLDCRRQAAEIQKFTGYLPGEIAFFDWMNGFEFLKLMAAMRGLRSLEKRDYLIEMLELDCSGKIRKMSKGMKQKLGIVSAMMHDPNVLILDEPTSGLDPLMQKRFFSLIQAEKENGKTILMSSHSFDEVERTCDRIGIIRYGRLVAVEDITTLLAAQRKTYTVTFADHEIAADFVRRGFEIVSRNDNVVEVAIQANLTEFLATLPQYQVTSLDTAKLGLEEVFMQYYGKDGSND